MRQRLGWQVALMAAIGSGITAPAAAEQRNALTIVVNVISDAKVTADMLRAAQADTTRIYSNIGIELVWRERFSGGDMHLTIRVIEKPLREAGRSAMGVAPRNGTAGTLLFAFYSRIESFAHQHDKSVSQILGHVMAHEMGHLLLPHGSHSMSGIMVADWNRAQAEDIGHGSLSFTAEQGEEIRRKVARLSTCDCTNP